VTFTVVSGPGYTVSPYLYFSGLGSVVVAANQAGNGIYLAAPQVTQTITEIQATPTITFVGGKNHDFDAPFTVSASSNAPGAITYSVLSGPGTVSGSTLTLTGAAGTVVVQANQAATTDYTAATQTASFVVTKGTVWVSNQSEYSGLSAFDLSGVPYSSSAFTGGGETFVPQPTGMAFDSSGNLWVANKTSSVSRFNGDGVALSSTALTGGVSSPGGIAVDGLGNAWVANGNGTLTEFSNAGVAVSPSSGYPTGATGSSGGIAIDASGTIWISNTSSNTVTEVFGGAAPSAPLSTGVANGTTGVRP
jgi:hypothetical protein